MRSGITPFYRTRNPKNFLDPFKIDFHSIHKWVPDYKDEDEQEYLRLRNQRR